VLVAFAFLSSVACIVFSARRLAAVVSPTRYDAKRLLAALHDADAMKCLQEAFVRRGEACWERDVLEAASEPSPAAREALLDEQVMEAGWAIDRYARVPRVCASIATSSGFLCAAVTLITTLGQGAGMDAGADGGPGPGEAMQEALTAALGTLGAGLVGTAFCVAVYMRARALAKARRAATDRLVDRVRALAAGAG
jgi:hypothetical protein